MRRYPRWHDTDRNDHGRAGRGPIQPTITTQERRRRLGVRHHLALPASTPEQVARDLVGLHSSDPATVHLSARARIAGYAPEQLEADLYERRSLLRMLGMRRTMFVVPRDLAATMDAACTRALEPGERRRLVRLVTDQGLTDDGEPWVERVLEQTLAAVRRRGQATATELLEDVPELSLKLRFGEGKSWGGEVGMSTRVLFLLATQGRIIRARPLGTWRSSQYRWAATEDWLGGPLPALAAESARTGLARRWLASYGPGTLSDLTWWTGWTVARTRSALQAAGAVTVRLPEAEGPEGEGYVLADDLDPTPDPGPWVALLPSLDSTVMGWQERAWYLQGLAPELFDRNGNAGPTVWSEGVVVGGWAQRADGEVAVRLLADIGTEASATVTDEADRLRGWLGEHRVLSRFPSPLEKQLRG